MSDAARLRVGMNARLFPGAWRPAREEIAFAQTAGFDGLQFPGEADGLSVARLGDTPEAVGATLRDAGLFAVMELLFLLRPDGRLAANGKTPLEAFRANVPAIVALGCNPVHWHLAVSPSDPEAHDAAPFIEENVQEQFREAVQIAREHGFVLGFEHNDRANPLFSAPESCARLLEAVPDLGFVWDLNHTAPDDFDATMPLLARVQMLHLSDTPLPDTNHHLPLGLGTLPVAAYLQHLPSTFRGPAILEIGGLPKSGGYGRDTDAALRDSLEHLRRADL